MRLYSIVFSTETNEIQDVCFKAGKKLDKRYWLATHKNVQSAKECQEKYCQNNDKCKSFVFDRKRNSCILKRRDMPQDLTSAPDKIYGPKICPSKNTAMLGIMKVLFYTLTLTINFKSCFAF